MKISQMHILKKTFVLLIIFLMVGCIEENTPLIPPVDESTIEINFPIGKKAIYAVGSYLGNSDSLESYFLTIYSLQFNKISINDNSTEYVGIVERYNAPSIVSDSLPGATYPEYYDEGKLLLSLDDKWVLFQNSEIIDAPMMFMKRSSLESDTTNIPNWLYSQFPIYPRYLTPNTAYSVIRPSDGVDFLEIQREFEIMNYLEWDDIYGSDRGLHFSTEYILKFEDDYTLNYSGIIDETGIVVSTTTIDDFIIGGTIISNGVADTTSLHIINRRIVDFTNPDYTHELSWYAEYVKENGLLFLDNQ